MIDTRPWEKAEVAERFTALRRKAGLTQRQLGRLIGICRQSVNEIEGARVKPHLGTWLEFASLEAKHNTSIIMPDHWD